MSENKIRQRHEIPVEDTWNLEDLYVSDEAWEAELATIEEDKAAAAAFAGKLGASAADLLAYLTRMEQVDEEALCQGYRLAFPENNGELDEWLMAEDEYRNW